MTGRLLITAGLAALALLAGTAQAHDDDWHHPRLRTYRVTIENLTDSQPFSPPVVATHRGGVRMFRVGGFASPELEAIAEDGNEVPMAMRLEDSKFVTDVVDVGMPLTRIGTTFGMFTDSVTFEIVAKPGDKLSIATMLICTNDGITGLDRVQLPWYGTRTFRTAGYDAGTEDNTEMREDIVDPCSALGPAPLAGDPDGNEDAAVDSDPQRRIRHHPNIEDRGDLSPALHGWDDPVMKVTVERID